MQDQVGELGEMKAAVSCAADRADLMPNQTMRIMARPRKYVESRGLECAALRLREKIRHHEYRYYVLDDPEISKRPASTR